jgi:hypothetical protein
MGNKIGQIEIPTSPARKKALKKQRIKKFRSWLKSNTDFIPKFNRFTGYS